MSDEAFSATRAQELRVFLFLLMVLIPVLSICIVGGYGLVVWISQIFNGPPGTSL